MNIPINADFSERLVDALNQSEIKSRLNRIWLGGTSGPNGGQGQRPGGFIGQLIQSIVSYDTTEAATLDGEDSLVDNLNHMRYRIAQLELTKSSVLTPGIARVVIPSGVSMLELPDYAFQLLHLSANGLTVDPVTYTLSEYSTIVLDEPTVIDTVFTAQYILLTE